MPRLMPAVLPLGLAAATLSVVALANAETPDHGVNTAKLAPAAVAAPAPAVPKPLSPAPAQLPKPPAPEAAPKAPAPAQLPKAPAPAQPPQLAPAVSPAQPQALPAPAKAPEQVVPQAAQKSLPFDYQPQVTSYWCGPAATRIALSTQTQDLPDQAGLAAALGTTENGTDHIRQVTDFLNKALAGKGEKYETVDWGGKPLTDDMKQQLWNDTVKDVDSGRGIVANIIAPPGNQPPNYPSNETIYHYIAIVGYDAEHKNIQIADPAYFGDQSTYWLSLDQATSLIQPKGYAH